MKEKFSTIYKILIVVITGIGLALNFRLYGFLEAIVYFTNISNILVFLFYFGYFVLKVMKKLKKKDGYYIIKGMVTMAITLTMFVYQTMLSDSTDAFLGHPIENMFVHLIVPLMVILDYIIFGEKGNLKKNFPFLWSWILIVYQLFVVIYSFLGGTFRGKLYPYDYMDIQKYGILRVILNCTFIYIFFIGYGKVVQFIDKKWKKRV